MNPTARGFATRRRGPATEPGNVVRGIVAGGLPHQQTAPGIHCGLGFLDILEKGEFAMKAAPAAGLEQLGEIFQPLLCKRAPTRSDIAATCHVRSMCHEPARKEGETDADATGTNQFDVTVIFCGKLSHCPARAYADAAHRPKASKMRKLSSLFTVKQRTGTAELRRLSNSGGVRGAPADSRRGSRRK
jgi:hypothetical protein